MTFSKVIDTVFLYFLYSKFLPHIDVSYGEICSGTAVSGGRYYFQQRLLQHELSRYSVAHIKSSLCQAEPVSFLLHQLQA